MDHRVELAAVEPAHELRRRHEIGKLTAGEIAPLAVAAEHIADGNIGAPCLVEARDHVRTDEPGPAGDQQHRHRKTGCVWDRPGMPPGMPPLARRTAHLPHYG